ncbi:MAG: DUF4097 family beta strand repeat-containing protein [Gammaproteobacteria bacterium]|nr:DUF4097 family beta strand repeat-containing protein [Gammaproteobacteria bacterium]
MKNRIYVALFGAFVISPAFADQEVDESLDAAADGEVDISNVAGSIAVAGWSRNSVRVQGTLGDDVEELIFERDGDDILIKVKVPRNHGRDIDSDLVINVPENSSIDVSGVSADIEVDGVVGEQSLATVSGDVATRSAQGDVEAASVSGDIEVSGEGEDAETEAATVSGDVTLSGLAGSVEAESVSGDVSVVDGSFDEAYLESVNGDLLYNAELRDGGELAMESVNGTIEVTFTSPVSARFDIETFNGSIRNCFGPKPERTSRYSPGLELSFTQGDGDGQVAIETLNGSVRICDQ